MAASPLLTESSTTPGEVASRNAPGGPGPNPVILAVSSALGLWLAFPPVERGYLAWFALAPLFLLIRSERSPGAIYLGAWLGGLTFWLLAVSWVRLTDPSAWLAWVAMAAFLSLWWPVFLALARYAVRRLGLPLMLAAPVVWVALEYVRAYALTGFPWYYLAHTQYRALAVIQFADLVGAWGPSLLVALVNAWLVEVLSLPLLRPTAQGPRLARPQVVRLGVVGGLALLALGYGGYCLATAEFRDGPRLALLQSNIKQEIKMSRDSASILAEFRVLVDRALAATPKPDLIVWPETSYPRGFPMIEPGLDDVELGRQARLLHPDGTAAYWRSKVVQVRRELVGWVDEMQVPMLVGSTFYRFGPGGPVRYNSALLIKPGSDPAAGPPARYDKLHLVPFGEYVPLLETFPWLTRLTPYRTGYIPNLQFGAAPTWFEFEGLRLATAICFEDTVPQVVRRFFAEAPRGQQPDLLLNLSNDGWFQGSAELDMHLAVSVFRAIEHRVPLARSVNTGITALIDGNGAIRERLPKQVSDVLVAVVPLDDRTSLYTVGGDWLALGCLALSLGLVPTGLIRARWRRRAALAA